jgi:DNA-binding MarR family transcriptional regulator
MTSRWGLLTNHALVLINVIEHPRSTLRDIAAAVGITERATLSILRALEADAIIGRRKEGRRNFYTVDVSALLAYRAHAPYSIEQLASALFVLSGRIPGASLPPGMQRASRTIEPGTAEPGVPAMVAAAEPVLDPR